MFLNVCKQTFLISYMRISQKAKGVLMWNLQHIIFMWRQIFADFQICISVPFNIKILAKSNKIELSEEFIAMWKEEQSLWDAMSRLYRDKNEKDKSLTWVSDKFQIFSNWYFRIKFCFRCGNLFSAFPGDSQISVVLLN